MADDLDLVAFDTGIFHAGLFKGRLLAEESLCPLIIDAARDGLFRLLVLNLVLDELIHRARMQGWLARMEDALLEFLSECETVWLDPPIPAEMAEHKGRLWAKVRHEADAEVAVEVWKHRPDFLVHTNRRHWGPQMDHPLGGVRVVRPAQFLREMGVTPPPPAPGGRRRFL